MSRTYRKVPGWATNGDMAVALQRGHIPIPKMLECREEVWRPKAKKLRKKVLAKKQRLNCTKMGKEKYNENGC